MNTYTIICIEKNKTMQDRDAKFKELGHAMSIDGTDLAEKAIFNRDLWRVCVVAKVS